MKMEHLEKYLHGEAGEGLMILAGITLFLLLILFLLIFDKVENIRFKHWFNRYGMLELVGKPWRTIVPWHRAGSKWYRNALQKVDAVNGGAGFDASDERFYKDINKTTKVRGYRYR